MAKPYIVGQGECLSSIAQRSGFADYKLLHEHSANRELKNRRPNPNVLAPGDLVAIPEAIPTQANRATGSLHEFTVNRAQPRLKLQILGTDGKALANQDYELIVFGKSDFGTTDGNGLVDKPLEGDPRTATLKTTVTDGEEVQQFEWNLKIGAIDPLTTTTGVQERLGNLGYYFGEIDGCFGPVTRGALMAFQSDAELEPTGFTDDDTLTALEKAHDQVTE